MPSKRTLLIIALTLLAAAAVFAAPKHMSVTVKESQVRATPTYLGKILAVVKYGDRLQVLEEQSGWAKVNLPSGKGQGWVNLAALTTKKIALTAGEAGSASGATSGEVALAGKGFNKEVEAKYRDEKKLDYSWIDTMETYRVSPEQVLAFLQAGGLPAAGGAQ